MKNILTLFSIILYSTFFSQDISDKSDIKVRYIMLMASDSTLLKDRNEASIYSYTLLCNSKKSIYADDKAKSYYDYIKNNVGNYSIQSPSTVPRSLSSIYKNDDKIIATLPIGRRELYRFEEPLLKWELIKGKKKTIMTYSCNLAKTTSDTGKVYYAWYTSDVPISEGPFRFKGLNGLVLEVYNEQKTILISATEINKVNELIEPLNYVTVYDIKDKAQFLKKRKEVIENPNLDTYRSKNTAEMNGQEIKIDRRLITEKANENNLLD